MNIVVWVIVGAIGGWLATMVSQAPGRGVLGNVGAGVIGGVIVGGVVAGLSGADILGGFSVAALIGALVGGFVVSWIYSFYLNSNKTLETPAKPATTTTAQNSAAGAMMKDAERGAMGTVSALGASELENMMRGVLGDNMKSEGASSIRQMFMPLAENLSAKIGVSPEVGQMILMFAASKVAQMTQGSTGTPTTGAPTPGSSPTRAAAPASSEVLGRINSGQGVDASMIQKMGLSKELAGRTGISEQQATEGLEYAMGAISAGMSGQKSFQGTQIPDMSVLGSLLGK